MMNATNENPRTPWGRAGDSKANCLSGRQYPTPKRRLAPFSHRLDPASKTVAVITGSDGWTRGNSLSCWFFLSRLLLPYGEQPALFQWPVSGRDCLVYGFGDPEPRERLISLSVDLVRSGAAVVYWRGQFVQGSDGDIHLVKGDLSSPLSPVFIPNREVAA